ncbi:MAG: hypothetical protein ACI4L9_06735 [Candidatus Coproplasma sp.]
MKRITKLFATAFVACLLCAVLALTGCGKGNVKFITAGDGKAENAVFTASKEVLPLDGKTSVADYINALKDRGELDFTAEDGAYGLFITSVNGVENVTDENGTHGWSWAIYTNLTELDGVIYSTSDYGTYEADGLVLNSASYGVSGLPCVEGYTYALVYSEWNWG